MPVMSLPSASLCLAVMQVLSYVDRFVSLLLNTLRLQKMDVASCMEALNSQLWA
jgi:hypothetical protein